MFKNGGSYIAKSGSINSIVIIYLFTIIQSFND